MSVDRFDDHPAMLLVSLASAYRRGGLGSAELVADVGGPVVSVGLTDEQAAAVTERTEGWPAGLYLAALIARESRGQERAVTGDDRYVADYLYREALLRQPEDVRRFLRCTAVLDQLSGPLCDAVPRSLGTAGQLRRLEAASLFVVPLDRHRQWYRYHALFREFLLCELGRSEPGLITTLHRRAADWYEANGSPALALEHLLHTTDWDRSVQLATALALPTFNAGRLSTLQRWLRAIGDANIECFPPLAKPRCYEAAMNDDTAQAERWAAFVDAATASWASRRATRRCKRRRLSVFSEHRRRNPILRKLAMLHEGCPFQPRSGDAGTVDEKENLWHVPGASGVPT